MVFNEINLKMDTFSLEQVEHNIFSNVLQEASYDRMYRIKGVLIM